MRKQFFESKISQSVLCAKSLPKLPSYCDKLSVSFNVWNSHFVFAIFTEIIPKVITFSFGKPVTVTLFDVSILTESLSFDFFNKA